MLDELTEGLRQFTFLRPQDLIDLSFIVKLKRLKKGEHFVRVGDYNYQAVKVLKGLLCHYVVDQDGLERALMFVPEGMNSGSMQTTIFGKAADENIIAFEDTLMICVDVRKLNELAENNPRILKLLNHSYKQVIAETAERIRFLIVHNAEERYLHFCETYPTLVQRIKLKEMASYLGITVTSLSRIRARLSRQ
jgi:CRP-like cAMP-binding protein